MTSTQQRQPSTTWSDLHERRRPTASTTSFPRPDMNRIGSSPRHRPRHIPLPVHHDPRDYTRGNTPIMIVRSMGGAQDKQRAGRLAARRRSGSPQALGRAAATSMSRRIPGCGCDDGVAERRSRRRCPPLDGSEIDLDDPRRLGVRSWCSSPVEAPGQASSSPSEFIIPAPSGACGVSSWACAAASPRTAVEELAAAVQACSFPSPDGRVAAMWPAPLKKGGAMRTTVIVVGQAAPGAVVAGRACSF